MNRAIRTVGGLTLVALLTASVGAAEDRDALWKSAHLHYQLDELDQAEAEFERADRLEPHWYSALMLGAIAERRFRFRHALLEYRRALELDPSRDATRGEIERVEGIVSDLERFRDADRLLARDLAVVIALALAGGAVAFVLAVRP